MQEKVLESRKLLLVKKLFHDLKEVSCQDGQGILVGVEEVADSVHKGVVGLRESLFDLFFGFFLDLSSSKFRLG